MKKDSIIECPSCSVAIARLTKDAVAGDRVDASLFAGISQEIKNGDSMKCKNCGATYNINTK